MKKAAVIYRSRTGTTRRLAEEIGTFLASRDVEASVASIGEFDMRTLGTVDYLLLGCWTNGLFIVRQHPDEPWLAFARDLPAVHDARVGLFTTYKLATGSMFAKMREPLQRIPDLLDRVHFFSREFDDVRAIAPLALDEAERDQPGKGIPDGHSADLKLGGQTLG